MYVLGMRPQRTGKSVDRGHVSFCVRFCVTLFVTRRAKTAAGRRGAGRSRSRRTCSRSRRSARRAGLGEARFVILQDSHIDLSGFICWFFDPLSEQAGNHCGGRSTAAEAPGVERCRCACTVQFHVLPATSFARSFLLHAVCANTFLFLSFASVSNNQTNSPEVSMGSIAFVFVVHSIAFFFCPCVSVTVNRCAWCT